MKTNPIENGIKHLFIEKYKKYKNPGGSQESNQMDSFNIPNKIYILELRKYKSI